MWEGCCPRKGMHCSLKRCTQHLIIQLLFTSCKCYENFANIRHSARVQRKGSAKAMRCTRLLQDHIGISGRFDSSMWIYWRCFFFFHILSDCSLGCYFDWIGLLIELWDKTISSGTSSNCPAIPAPYQEVSRLVQTKYPSIRFQNRTSLGKAAS